MATKNIRSKLGRVTHLETTNVVALPTAAPKRVRQCRSRTKAADRDALLRFPDIWTTPLERSAREKALKLLEVEVTAPMALALAMFQQMETMDQWKAQLLLGVMVETHTDAASAALTLTEWITAPPHEQRAISDCLKHIQGRGE